jgi:hypothetical protein
VSRSSALLAGVAMSLIGGAAGAEEPDAAEAERSRRGERGSQAGEVGEPADDRGRAAREIDAQADELETAGLATRRFTPRRGYQLGWQLLDLPGRVIELIFAPVQGLVIVGERYRIPQRAIDLTEITETISVIPRIKAATGEGFGAGANLKYASPLASQQKLSIGGEYQLDGDYEVDLGASRRLASIEGRLLELEAEWEVDRSNNYFGIGSGTEPDDERELGIDLLEAAIRLDLHNRGAEVYYGTFELAYLNERLYPGIGNDPSVGEPGDTVAPPPGFGERTNYARVGFRATADRRDTAGRTREGSIGAIEGNVTADVSGSGRNAVNVKALGAVFIPILQHRTLVVHAGAGVAEAITDDAEVPLNALIVLGRDYFLRGYSNERFRAHRGWWGGLEYRYPVWYLSFDPTVLTATWFLDVGREGSSFADLIDTPVRYAYGVGFTVERYKSSLAGFQIGRSPEGFELILSTGGVL